MADLAAVTRIDITARDQTGAALSSVERGLKNLASQAGAIASTLGVAAFGTMVKSAIDAADQVNKLVQQTGIAANQIDRLTVVAKLNDVEAASLVKSYKALATAMNEASDPASKQAKMFESLGVRTRDAQGNMRDLATVTLEMARAFREAKDGPEKMAVAVGAFGKAGIEMIPVLNNMAEDMERATKIQEAFGEITQKTATAGDQFNDSMTLLGEGMRRMFLPAVESLGPAMERFATAMIDVGKQGLIVTPIMQTLFDDVLPAAVETVGALIIATNSLGVALVTLVKGLTEASNNDTYAAKWAAVKKAFSDADDVIARSNATIATLMDRSKAAAPALDQTAAATNRMAAAARAIADGPGKKAADTFKEMSDAVKKWYDNAMNAIAADEQIVANRVKEYEALRKVIEAEEKIVEQIDQSTASYEKQIDALKLNEVQILAKERARQQEILTDKLATTGIDETTAAIERNIEALDKLINAKGADEAAKQAKAAADEWEKAANSIGDSLTDALLRGFESGKDFAKNFADTLYNMFRTLVLRPVIQGVLAPVAGGITSMFSGGAAASGGGIGSAGSLLGMGGGGWLSGIGDAIFGGGGGAAFGAGFSSPFSTLGSIFAGGGEFAAPGMALASGIGAALPVAAIAFAAYSLLKKDRGGPKGGGFGTSGLIGALPGSDGGRWFTPNGADTDVQAITAATLASFRQALAALGGSGVGGFALGYDTDPQGAAPNRLHAGAYVNGQMVYNAALGDLGRDDAALQSALELESKRALLAALQASDLPAQIAAVFDSVAAGSASSSTIDNLLAFGGAMKVVIDSISGSVVEDAQTAWERSQRSSIQVLNDMGAEVIRLAGEMDGTVGSMQALATATSEYRSAVVQTLVAIKQIAQDMTELFANTRQSLTTFGMSPEQLYNFYRTDADAAMAELATTTDPARVAALGQRINADINAAFNALPEEARTGAQNPLIQYLNGVDAFVQARLADIGASLSSSTTEPFAAASSALDNAASKFQAAADDGVNAAQTQLQAANINLQAAQINLQAANTPVVAVVRTAEVNG